MGDMYNTRREPKACRKCGHVRVVKVRDDRKMVDGVFTTVGESYNHYCTACEYLANAKKYLELSRMWAKRAQVQRTKQDEK